MAIGGNRDIWRDKALILESVLDALNEQGLKASYHKSYTTHEVLAVSVSIYDGDYSCFYRIWPTADDGVMELTMWWPHIACPDKMIRGGFDIANPDVYDQIVTTIRADSGEKFAISKRKAAEEAAIRARASSEPASPRTRTSWGARPSGPYSPYTGRSS